MNRVLKFRVWDKKYNKFISDGDSNDGHGLTLNGEFAFCSESQFGYVDPEDKDRFTIQQYTGLEDDFGNEIFEGDIIELGDGTRGIVKFGNGRFFHTGKTKIMGMLYWSKVVGNIFENPKLCEK